MSTGDFPLNIPSHEDMRRAGHALGLALAKLPGTALLVGIEGDLGAGKTVFASGVLGALGIAGPVRSPTYTLIEPYECAGRTVYHLDLYRLTDPREVEALGVRDLLGGNAVLLIEWPERGAGALPAADLHVCITYAAESPGAGREVRIAPGTAAGARLAERLKGELAV